MNKLWMIILLTGCTERIKVIEQVKPIKPDYPSGHFIKLHPQKEFPSCEQLKQSQPCVTDKTYDRIRNRILADETIINLYETTLSPDNRDER